MSEWWRQYQQMGEAALHQHKRGNKWGEGRTLTATEQERLQQMIREYFPDELSIDSALWRRSAVQTLISDECGMKMPSAHGWRVPQALGLYSPKAAQTRL